jgi:hypothetical protein
VVPTSTSLRTATRARIGIDRLVLGLPISRRTYKEKLESYALTLGLG